MNRVVTGRLAAIHFAATEGARGESARENVAPKTIHVTGNSGIDAVLNVRDRLVSGELTARQTRQLAWIRSASGKSSDRGDGAPAGELRRRI